MAVSGARANLLQAAGAAGRRVLSPSLAPLSSASIARGDELWAADHVDDAVAAYEHELACDTSDHFSRSLAHKRIVSVVAATQGIDAAFARYGLVPTGPAPSLRPADIVCCTTLRDEAERLPYFFDYYERLGVDRFLVVDNGSRDGTSELLARRPGVHVWRSDASYDAANYGVTWVELLLRAYARGHWCLVVDADELLYYPDVETRSLHELCHDLDRRGESALSAVLLDLYSDGPIADASCEPGADPLGVCRFFDREFADQRFERATPWENISGFTGGVRRRVFGEGSDVFLSKVPLFRYTDDRLVVAGTHGTNTPREEVSLERGALLHLKFTARFVERIEDEIRARSGREAQGESYSLYAQVLADAPALSLYDPEASVEFHGSRQLVELGVMCGAEPPRATLDEYVGRMHEQVPGWLTDDDVRLLKLVDAAQRAAEVHGDLLEVGVFQGRTAILLGYLLRADEELVAWDLFSPENLDGEADADIYRGLTQHAFERNYLQYHRALPTVVARSSTEIPRARLGRRFRLVHVDGSHRYEIVRQDIAAALDLLVDGGVVVIDDYRTLPHALGVAAATWEAVTAGRLVPLMASEQKLYACAADRLGLTPAWLRKLAVEQEIAGVEQEIAGHAVLAVSNAVMTSGRAEPAPPPAPAPADGAVAGGDEVDELRRRLALIEGSRTWRLRSRLARLLPTRR